MGEGFGTVLQAGRYRGSYRAVGTNRAFRAFDAIRELMTPPKTNVKKIGFLRE